MNTAAIPDFPAPQQLASPTDLTSEGARLVTAALNPLVADAFALYLKTKNYHWHVWGSHFHDYHLMFDEQADEVLAMTDALAERVRKLGGTTLRSVGHVALLQRVEDDNEDLITPLEMLGRLQDDQAQLASRLRAAHQVCDEQRDYASASLLETYIDEAEKRAWMLFESAQGAEHAL